MSAPPLLSYDGIPTGKPVDMYMYIFLSGVCFCFIVGCFVYFWRYYLRSFSSIKETIIERKNFNSKSFAAVFTIVGFLGYQSISLGDLANVSGSNSSAGYGNWSVILYMLGTAAFTSIASLLLTQLFIALQRTNRRSKLTILNYLSWVTAIYSFISPILYICLAFPNIGNFQTVFYNHNYQLSAELGYCYLMLIVNVFFGLKYKSFQNKNFMTILLDLCVLLLALTFYAISAAYATITKNQLPTSFWKTNEFLIVLATAFVVLYQPSKREKRKLQQKLQLQLFIEDDDDYGIVNYLKDKEINPLLMKYAKKQYQEESIKFLNCMVIEIGAFDNESEFLAEVSVVEIQKIFNHYINSDADYELNLSAQVKKNLEKNRRSLMNDKGRDCLTGYECKDLFQEPFWEVIQLVKDNLLKRFLLTPEVRKVLENRKRIIELDSRMNSLGLLSNISSNKSLVVTNGQTNRKSKALDNQASFDDLAVVVENFED